MLIVILMSEIWLSNVKKCHSLVIHLMHDAQLDIITAGSRDLYIYVFIILSELIMYLAIYDI